VHPLALATLTALEIPTEGLESKSWDIYRNQHFDVVITVCAEADLSCPVFPGGAIKVAWPLPDPSFMPGTDHERVEFAIRIAERLRLRLMHLAKLDFERTPKDQIRTSLEQLRDL
jgi:arsenate reductase